MADGTHKPIAAVRVGDRVQATDPATGRTEARTVVALIAGTGAKDLVEITVETDGARGADTGTVVATDGHPFWVDDHGGWVNAGNVHAGDRLRTPDGQILDVVATHSYTENRRVHNLSVEGLHTYYVEVGDEDILVHNCTAGDWGVPREPGVYALHFNSGQTYVGMSTGTMHRRVDRAFTDPDHAVFRAGLTPQDLSNVQFWSFPNLARNPMRHVEQTFMDHFRGLGRRMLNRRNEI